MPHTSVLAAAFKSVVRSVLAATFKSVVRNASYKVYWLQPLNLLKEMPHTSVLAATCKSVVRNASYKCTGCNL